MIVGRLTGLPQTWNRTVLSSSTRGPCEKPVHPPRVGARRLGSRTGAPRGGRAKRDPALQEMRNPVVCLIAFWTRRNLAHVVPRLHPRCFTALFSTAGLEGCGELVALATPGQLAAVSISTCGALPNRAWTSSSTAIASACGSKC